MRAGKQVELVLASGLSVPLSGDLDLPVSAAQVVRQERFTVPCACTQRLYGRALAAEEIVSLAALARRPERP